MSEKKAQKIVVLATGGTIAGLADDPSRPQQYSAGRVSIDALLQGIAGSDALSLVSEQVAQIDSKDMGHALWKTLAERCAYWLQQTDVQGLVISHGTDTIEETAYFLEAVLRPDKPVALTCAMLPANAPDSDGPGNLRDALAWVTQASEPGVVVVCAAQAHAAVTVQKTYTDRCAAFDSGPAGSLARMKQGIWQRSEPVLTDAPGWPAPRVSELPDLAAWPQVDLVFSHAGANGQLVRTASATRGWVVAATGQGTVHHDLAQALLDAQAQGAVVVRASRCPWGSVQDTGAHNRFEGAGSLNPVKARIALMLRLMCSDHT